MKVYIETYGCSSSRSDSEIMAGLLSEAGHELVDDISASDVIIVNTCIVKQPTEDKMRFRLQQLQEKYPKKKLIIAGCMPEAEPKALRKIAENASLVSTNHITNIVDAVESSKGIELTGKNKTAKCDLPKIRKNPLIDVVEICSGCNYACAYCITKLAKGSLFSYPNEKIVSEIENALKQGAREFWLTGQDVAAYNYDGVMLPELLNEISNIEGEFFVRLGMMNPSSVLPVLNDLVEAYKNNHVFRFLHLPVQSGSDEVLKKMNRAYSIKDFKGIIRRFRKAMPEITLWTDVIVGFPEESDEDFENTMGLIKEIKPDFTNISAYGARPGTKAAKMQQIDSNVKKQRTRTVSNIVEKMCLGQNKRWVGWTGNVLIDEYNPAKKNWIGRNYCYKPVAVKDAKMGQAINVKVIDAEKTCLIGLAL